MNAQPSRSQADDYVRLYWADPDRWADGLRCYVGNRRREDLEEWAFPFCLGATRCGVTLTLAKIAVERKVQEEETVRKANDLAYTQTEPDI